MFEHAQYIALGFTLLLGPYIETGCQGKHLQEHAVLASWQVQPQMSHGHGSYIATLVGLIVYTPYMNPMPILNMLPDIHKH